MNKGVGTGVIMLLIGLLLLALSSTDAYTLAFNKVRIEDKSFGTYEEDEIAEGEIEYVVDKVGEASLKKKLFGIPYSNKTVPLYLIANDGGYILLQSDKDAGKLETLRQQTEQYFSGSRSEVPDKVKYIGKATEVNDEILQVLEAYFTSHHVSEDNWAYAVSLYVLVGFDVTLTVVQLVVSCAFIFIGVLLILIFRRYVQGKEVYVGEAPPAAVTSDGSDQPAEDGSDSGE